MFRTLTLALLLAATGCGAIIHGTLQDVDLACSVPGATLSVDNRKIQPGRIPLKRGDHHLVRASAPGYETNSCYIENDLNWWCLLTDCLVFGGVGVIVDAITGGWFYLEPESVTVLLEREAGSGPTPLPVQTPPTPPAPPASPASSPQAAKPKTFCPACGAKLSDGAQFCSACGAKQ